MTREEGQWCICMLKQLTNLLTSSGETARKAAFAELFRGCGIDDPTEHTEVFEEPMYKAMLDILALLQESLDDFKPGAVEVGEFRIVEVCGHKLHASRTGS